MQSTSIDYFDGKQKLIGQFLFDPTSSLKTAIILYPAFEGRGEFVLDYAKKLVQQGFMVFVADMYGNAKVGHTLDECIELYNPFAKDRGLARRRAVLAYETLLQQKEVLRQKIGAVGFCFGGMCALELARSGVDLLATVSLHGVLAQSDLKTHPMKGKFLILHGFKDPQVPPQSLEKFAAEMEEAKVLDWTFTFFGEAKHSFTDPKTGSFDPVKEKGMGREYDPIAAKRSFQYVVDFFQE